MTIIRDPKRIEECLYYIDKIWQSQPDTRFNQLIYNLHSEFYHTTSKGIFIEDNDERAFDMFYIEDDVFIEWLKSKVNYKKGEKIMSLIQIDRTMFKRLLLYTKSLEDWSYSQEALEGIRKIGEKFNNGKTVDEQIDDFIEQSKQLNKE